ISNFSTLNVCARPTLGAARLTALRKARTVSKRLVIKASFVVMRLVFVDDPLDLGRRPRSVSRFVISAVVARHFAFALELLVAVVRRPNSPVFRFSFRAWNRNHFPVVFLILCHSKPPGIVYLNSVEPVCRIEDDWRPSKGGAS